MVTLIICAIAVVALIAGYAAVHYTWIRPGRRPVGEECPAYFPFTGWLLEREAASLERREAELDKLNRRAAAVAEANKAPPAPAGYAGSYRGICSYRGISSEGFVELNLETPLALASGEMTQWITTSVQYPIEDIGGVHWALRKIFAGQKMMMVAAPHRLRWMEVRFPDGMTLEHWLQGEIQRLASTCGQSAQVSQPAQGRGLPKNTLN